MVYTGSKTGKIVGDQLCSFQGWRRRAWRQNQISPEGHRHLFHQMLHSLKRGISTHRKKGEYRLSLRNPTLGAQVLEDYRIIYVFYFPP